MVFIYFVVAMECSVALVAFDSNKNLNILVFVLHCGLKVNMQVIVSPTECKQLAVFSIRNISGHATTSKSTVASVSARCHVMYQNRVITMTCEITSYTTYSYICSK